MNILLSDQQIKKLFNLSKIYPNPHDVAKLTKKLQSIAALVEQIKEADCDNIEPMYSVCQINYTNRQDKTHPAIEHKKLFSNLAQEEKNFAVQHGYFRIRKNMP